MKDETKLKQFLETCFKEAIAGIDHGCTYCINNFIWSVNEKFSLLNIRLEFYVIGDTKYPYEIAVREIK